MPACRMDYLTKLNDDGLEPAHEPARAMMSAAMEFTCL